MTELSPELQSELIAFVRDYASDKQFIPTNGRAWEAWAKDIAAKLPKPVDPDIEGAMKPENPPAFPSVCQSDPGHPASLPGMTLRDWFAGQVLAGMSARDSFDPGQGSPQQRASLAYIDADAMLGARELERSGK